MYATERAEEISTLTRILFVDSGYSATVMTLAEFEPNGDVIQSRILGTNWDLDISANNVDVAFANFIFEKIIAKTSDPQLKEVIQNSIITKDRLWTRVVKEASRLKTVLSANQAGTFSVFNTKNIF